MNLSWAIKTCSVAGLVFGCSGCESAWFNGFLDPTQLGNFRHNVVNEIQKSISLRDKPYGLPGAVDPTPDDVVAEVEEYRLEPSDSVRIQMMDFIAPDYESEYVPRVDELGEIHIPQLGWLKVEGMSVRDLQSELIEQSKAAGIYQADSTPSVDVTLLTRQRTYNISGAITSAGEYPIPESDFRLQEAVNAAGGLSESIKTIFVIRDEPRQKRFVDQPVDRSREGGLPPPPVSPVSMSAMEGGPGGAAGGPSGKPEPGVRLAQNTQEAPVSPDELERLLIESTAPDGTSAPAGREERDQPPPRPAETSPSVPPFIFVNDRFIEAPATQEVAPPPPVDSRAPGPSAPPRSASAPVDWEELAAEGQQRIIRIPADRLRKGDSNYNIVIKNHDWIRLDAGPIGLVYVMGHVLSPGVYALNGESLTLRQVLAAARGLDPVAWPTRCEIIRRIDEDREEITQWDLARIIEGKDPDLFLKPNDVINVGTHAIAPFLATIRNSFRLTYGFGFVYDRNFADFDQFFGRANPRNNDVRGSLLQGLGL